MAAQAAGCDHRQPANGKESTIRDPFMIRARRQRALVDDGERTAPIGGWRLFEEFEFIQGPMFSTGAVTKASGVSIAREGCGSAARHFGQKMLLQRVGD